MKKINIRRSLIITLLLTIIILSVGFVTITIKYHNLASKDITYNVEFTKVKKISSSKGSIKEPKSQIDITKNSKELNMDFNLYSPKDEILYEITIKNTGTMSIEIIDLLMSPDYINDYKTSISPVKMTLTDIEGKVLGPGEDTIVKLKISYEDTKEIVEKSIKGKIGIIASSH